MSEESTIQSDISISVNPCDDMSPTPSSSIVHNETVQEEIIEKKDVSCEYHERSYSPFKKCNNSFINHLDYNRDVEVSVIRSSTQVISTSQVETYRKQDDMLPAQIDCDHINSNSQTNSQTIVETKTIRSNPFQFSDGVESVTPMKSRRKSLASKLTSVSEEDNSSIVVRRSLPPVCISRTTLLNEDFNKASSPEEARATCLGCTKGKELKLLYKELQYIKDKINQFETELENKRNCVHGFPKENKDEHKERDDYYCDEEVVPPLPTMPSLPVGRSNTLISQQQHQSNKMTINIGGIVHETYRSTIKSIPDTRLTWLARNSARNSPEYNPVKDEFFFDRHPQVFSHILNYYRTGKLHVPYDVCGPLFEEELQYWGIDDTQVESCCWLNYRQHRDAQETLKDFEGIEFENDMDNDSEPDLSKYGFSVDQTGNDTPDRTWYQKWQPYIWRMTEDPHSSKKAKGLAYVSMGLITLSVILFCVETMVYFKNPEYVTTLLVLEGICVSYFTIELVIRFAFCVNKTMFLKDVLNWIDLCASIPFFVNTIDTKNVPFLQSIRVIRVFRIIKLSKHSIGLQILGHTLRASIRELLLLIFFLLIGIIIFSSLLYFCEYEEKDTKFTDIPTTFWWAVITMTTVGYGDMVPTTNTGKFIGAFCSICGVLMIALPVPVIVNNFNLYYSHAQARLKLPKKRRNMLCGAANALRSSEFYDDKVEQEGCNESGETRASVPRIDLEMSTTATAVSLEEEDEVPIDKEQLDNIHSRRMKKFSRRDSNTFVTKSIAGPDLSPRVRNGYALSKRRSLLPSVLPTIDSMPEVEQ